MNSRLEGAIDDFIFIESPKVTLSFKKVERGTHTKLVTVHRGGKTFKRKQRVGRKETTYESTKTYEEFINVNKVQIQNEVNKIKKLAKDIKDEKNRDKFFKEEMRDLKIKLTHIWLKDKIIKKSSLHPDNVQNVRDLNESGIGGLVGGIHESETYIVQFKDGSQAIHKTMMKGDIIGEVGTYETSKILGWDIVPETIQCDYGKGDGSCQKWIPDSMELTGDFIDGVIIGEKHFSDLSKIFVLDMITGNFDRHDGNVIIDSKDKCWAIDNEMVGKLNNAQLHMESLDEHIESGEGLPIPMINVLTNSIGDDIKLWQKFGEEVNKSISEMLQHKDKIIEYWSQYKESKEINTGVPIKEGIRYIKKNINHLQNYKNGEVSYYFLEELD